MRMPLTQPRENNFPIRDESSPATHRPGRLDGLTILRFAHAYESGGGLEQYLADLNFALGRRSRVTIVQMQLTTDRARLNETEEKTGGARVVKIPLWVKAESKHAAINAPPPGAWENCKAALRRRLLFTPVVYQALTKRCLKNWRVPRRAGEPDGAGAKFQELLGRFQVDLVVLHSSGGADASEIFSAAARAKIPAVMIHHFANDRFQSLALCRQAMQAGAVGGVCGVAVPDYLRGRFTNLSDGIDTDFFQRKNAQPAGRDFTEPVLFLPARITSTKGQLDLIRAGGELLRRGLRFQIALAGRVDADEFLAELKKEISAAGLAGRVIFTGQLDAAGLRDWYAAASILAFPTRHHEGLPRILLEAQAMELPAVVHDIGGTSEGIKDGQTGFLVAVGDQKGLVQRLHELLQNPTQRKQFGLAGRQWVEEKFSLGRLAERHETFYRNAIHS
jgi:glycosyltransferase involved in cell wall biosynthesis